MELTRTIRPRRQFAGQWHKLAAIMMHKAGTDHVIITAADVSAIQGSSIVVQELADGLHVRLVDEHEGARLARQAGELPT